MDFILTIGIPPIYQAVNPIVLEIMDIVKHNESTLGNEKPNLPKYLFWDWDYEAIDWQKGYRSIIARVLERGSDEEWQELIRYYGEGPIINALKKEIKYLPIISLAKYATIFIFNMLKWHVIRISRGEKDIGSDYNHVLPQDKMTVYNRPAGH